MRFKIDLNPENKNVFNDMFFFAVSIVVLYYLILFLCKTAKPNHYFFINLKNLINFQNLINVKKIIFLKKKKRKLLICNNNISNIEDKVSLLFLMKERKKFFNIFFLL